MDQQAQEHGQHSNPLFEQSSTVPLPSRNGTSPTHNEHTLSVDDRRYLECFNSGLEASSDWRHRYSQSQQPSIEEHVSPAPVARDGTSNICFYEIDRDGLVLALRESDKLLPRQIEQQSGLPAPSEHPAAPAGLPPLDHVVREYPDAPPGLPYPIPRQRELSRSFTVPVFPARHRILASPWPIPGKQPLWRKLLLDGLATGDPTKRTKFAMEVVHASLWDRWLIDDLAEACLQEVLEDHLGRGTYVAAFVQEARRAFTRTIEGDYAQFFGVCLSHRVVRTFQHVWNHHSPYSICRSSAFSEQYIDSATRLASFVGQLHAYTIISPDMVQNCFTLLLSGLETYHHLTAIRNLLIHAGGTFWSERAVATRSTTPVHCFVAVLQNAVDILTATNSATDRDNILRRAEAITDIVRTAMKLDFVAPS
ncbi:hypothetical protein FISHEDRAFT_69848 [Fistulina hepatica ATCC 64428]|uniref:Uncharacterized protein n=1 Tax=Fistulina hepatica ATCC 64428 TaxID=1128425 RepID=A0A0D7AKZ9_9AGAR|nr:hypothetical protein FISHEDRAFT_69848 [Fistulina hepatica ATCC 64428]